jgi:L,D-transpeptidase catalytic domain
MKHRTDKLALAFLVFCLLLGGWRSARAEPEDHSQLCAELEAAGFEIVDSGVAYGVPFVEIRISLGFSITTFCEKIPSLDADFDRCRNSIAFFNALNPNYIKTRTPAPNSIEADTLKIPLDFHQVPEIFPALDESLADYEQYLVVDIGKSYLALYEKGELRLVFPISSGAAGERTPLFSFKVEDKDKNHYSSLYDSWMPYALHLKGGYYIHGGVLPGRSDSAGCIRLPPDDAAELFKIVQVGTLGRIIDTPAVDRNIYPAEFCR